jgi:hypothetical protein
MGILRISRRHGSQRIEWIEVPIRTGAIASKAICRDTHQPNRSAGRAIAFPLIIGD